MFKVIIPIGSIFLVLVIVLFSTTNFNQLIVVSQNNITKKPINLKPNKYKDRYCNMTISDINYSAQVVLLNNDTLFFDDIGCLVLWLKNQKQKKDFILWVWAKDSNRYINAREAWYSQTEKTPMFYGFGAYEGKKKHYIDFDTVYHNMLNDKTLKNHTFKEQLLGNN
jgi:copper chaperone NosL